MNIILLRIVRLCHDWRDFFHFFAVNIANALDGSVHWRIIKSLCVFSAQEDSGSASMSSSDRRAYYSYTSLFSVQF